MDPQAVPYVIALIIASIISLGVALHVWSRHPTPGAASLTALMLSAAVFAFSYAMQVASRDLPTALLWYKISFPGGVALAPSWILFALRYTNRDKWMTWYHVVGLCFIPVLSLLLGWTNEQHHLYGSNFRMDTSGPFPLLRWHRGLGFWIHGLYAYAMTVIGAWLLIRYALRAPSLYRWQVISLFAGALAPIVGNLTHFVIHFLDIGVLSQIDLAPFTFPITGLIWAWALFRFRLLEVVPVARDAVIENMDDGIIVTDTENNIVDANPAMLELIERSSSEIIGEPIDETLPDWLNLTQYCHETEVSQEQEVTVDTGEIQRHFDLRISPLHDSRGDIAGWVCITRDITARKQSEQALEKYAVDLARSNAALQRFAFVASHHLQEPLRSTVTHLQLLEKFCDDQLDPRARKSLYYAIKNALHMRELLRDLLRFSRVDSQENTFQQISCEAIVKDAINALQELITTHDAVVTYDLGDAPKVMVNANQLRKVFTHLLENAIKFRQPDEPPCIHIAAQQQGDMWRFSVCDNSIGIDPEYHQQIFKVFHRLHTQDDYPGTGIGLALCQKIIERHGGRIWVESELGAGATFYFTLPTVESLT